MMGLEFLVGGALEFSEPGALLAFEETPEEMTTNVASLGFNLRDLVNQHRSNCFTMITQECKPAFCGLGISRRFGLLHGSNADLPRPLLLLY
jgi:hypothetical protein